MGKLKLWPQISRPDYSGAAVLSALDAGARALSNISKPATWAFKLGRKKLFYEKFFFRRKLQGKTGQVWAE